MKRRVSALLGVFLLGGMFGGTALVHAEGNVAKGKELAYTCHGCHGIANYKNAAPNYSVPKLGNQNANYIAIALKAYASGDRVHPTMHAQAASNSAQDYADMAAFFQGKGIAHTTTVVGTPPAAAQVCAACHGNNGISIMNEYPNLAGQHADYLEQALREYKSGKRKNAVMAGMVGNLQDADIVALAKFFSSQKGLCDTKQILDNNGQCK